MSDVLLIIVGLAGGLLLAGIVGAVVIVTRQRQPVADEAGQRMAELARLQVETSTRVQAMGDMLAGRQAELHRAVNERLDGVTHRLGQSLETNKQHTVDSLQKLAERLAVIDTAQKNITDLATQVTSLQSVLANKQTRGAFGQSRMEIIIQDSLPSTAYAFQHTLSNKTRPDCVIFLPDSRPLIIDAKFPLEAITALREAKGEDEKRVANQRFKQDVTKHLNDIAGKYLIPGETQDLAFMFIPSESVYAEIHEGFEDLVQKAHRCRVMMVSPTLLMLAISVVQQIRRDAEMRDAAEVVRTEVGHMMKDVKLLGERVRKLQTHFGQANEDLNNILTSASRIEKRATKIEELEFDDDSTSTSTSAEIIPTPMLRKLEAGE